MLLSGGAATTAALCGFAFLAGFTDSIVGGGGLIQVPALLVLLPETPVPVLFGINKVASSMGTTAAVLRYARGLRIDWRLCLPAAIASFALSFAGAHAVSGMDEGTLRPLVLALLVLVALYTWRSRDFGRIHSPKLARGHDLAWGVVVGGALGFYDGFFGPGVGSFLIFVFVVVFGYDFLAATSSAKVLNLGSNLSAALYFAATDQVLYGFALPMGACSVAGAVLGSRLALTRGVKLVRRFFLVVVVALICKLGWDLLR
ncbi:MAG TPA: TSUP family transporter [Gemmatimonadales bacterium]|nr:TSUP family transporter [Gemmatimonadales bacterium]